MILITRTGGEHWRLSFFPCLFLFSICCFESTFEVLITVIQWWKLSADLPILAGVTEVEKYHTSEIWFFSVFDFLFTFVQLNLGLSNMHLIAQIFHPIFQNVLGLVGGCGGVSKGIAFLHISWSLALADSYPRSSRSAICEKNRGRWQHWFYVDLLKWL